MSGGVKSGGVDGDGDLIGEEIGGSEYMWQKSSC